jgi:hypothetical protein
MTRATYNDYIHRFNAQDMTAFEDHIAPNLRMINGTLEFTGVDGMKAHYAKVWKSFSENLTIERFVSDEESLAVQMWAHHPAIPGGSIP